MPAVVKHTPAWLSRPSSGFDLFTSHLGRLPPEEERTAGPKRTIARRGTEIFVAVGKELRWSDLVLLRDNWETHHRNGNGRPPTSVIDERANETSFRILKVPISQKIRQLVISPTGIYLAILTSHMIHIAILPDPSHLNSEDTSPLKLKTFHVGPTAHVLEQSPLACALWHPLGVDGTCLVTVTVDAIVRIWELDTKNRWSFDSPTTAIDLRKLANGITSTQDFSPSKYGTTKGFSPDSFEMKVASAYLSHSGGSMDTAWSPMTLWVAMREGDIYALCPFLPSRLVCSPTMLTALAASIASHPVHRDETYAERKHVKADDRKTWISEILNQFKSDDNEKTGPFRISPDADQIFDITDLSVITSPDMLGESDNDYHLDGQVQSTIELLCIATSDSKIHLCVISDGVEGCWLPQNTAHSNKALNYKVGSSPELLLVQTVSIFESPYSSWPMFSPDPVLTDSVFVTHEGGVSHVNISLWLKRLGDELTSYTKSGIRLRTDLLIHDTQALVEHPIPVCATSRSESSGIAEDIPACVALFDSELGFFVLTSVRGEAQAVILEDISALKRIGYDAVQDYEFDDSVLPRHEPRPPYQPSPEFWDDSKIVEFVGEHPLNKGPRMMKEEIRFSPATLKLLMDIHRKLSVETHRLGQAAAELFRHCERLQMEFKQQIKEVNIVAERMEAVLGENGDDYCEENDAIGTANQIEHRIESVKKRQVTLESRYSELRWKLSRLNGRSLNDKENQWIAEIRTMNEMLGSPNTNKESGFIHQKEGAILLTRLGELKQIRSQLLVEVHNHDDHAQTGWSAGQSDEISAVRSTAMDDINALLERQTALIDATRSKLERLSILNVER